LYVVVLVFTAAAVFFLLVVWLMWVGRWGWAEPFPELERAVAAITISSSDASPPKAPAPAAGPLRARSGSTSGQPSINVTDISRW
jgi:hypothetical protein